jgi:integrase/recombinase XerD
MTIAQAITRFLDDRLVRNFSPRTVEGNDYDLQLIARFLTARRIDTVEAVTRAALRDFQEWLYREPTKRGHTRGVRNQYQFTTLIKTFFVWLRSEGILSYDPAAALEYARLPHELPRQVLTPKEARKVLEGIDTTTPIGYRDRTIMEVFYATGIRCQELIDLRVPEVNMEEELLRINKGKGNKDRVVPLSRIACRYLETYIKAVRPGFVRQRGEDRLFLSWRGRPLHRVNLIRLVTAHAKAAGLKKHVTCHTWRHTCATHLLKNQANLRHVQEILGHGCLSTTERYLHLNIDDLKAAHRRFHPREKDVAQ